MRFLFIDTFFSVELLIYSNIPLKDPSNIPDPYVKLYLLPGRSKESKRKTIIVKDSCDPVYDATFEYIISSAELKNTELEVTVATQKAFGSPIIGMVTFIIICFVFCGNQIIVWGCFLRFKPQII